MPKRRQIRLHWLIVDLTFVSLGAVLGIWIASARPDRIEGVIGLHAPIILNTVGAILGGLSLAGPIVVIRSRRGRRQPPRPGELIWATQGIATWLLWPPVVWKRLSGGNLEDTSSGVCYAYGTPLMALYLTIGLLAGGWLRPRRFRRRALPWQECFGLVLGFLWACTGLYVLWLLYNGDD